MTNPTQPVERRLRGHFREEVTLELSRIKNKKKPNGSNQSDGWGRRCSGRGNSTNGDVIPHHSSNQQIFTEKVPCAVNRRHGSASRSVLSSGDERPRKQIMSKRTVNITMEGLTGWHGVRGRASNPDSPPA